MPSDDDNKVARLKSNPQIGRGRSDTASGGDSARGQVIQVATRCATIDEFVERFAAFAWESSLVLPAASALPVGTQGRFVILLRDQTVAMRGRCRVTEAKPTPVSTRNPAVKKVMMRVALLEMDEASRAVHKRLIALRSAPVPLPIPPEPSETTQIEPARGGTAPGAAVPPAEAPPPATAAATPPPAAAPPAPPAAAPPAPAKTPPPAPRVNLSRTIIGVGVGPDGKAVLKHPTPPAVPPLLGNAPAPAPTPAPAAAPAPAPTAQALGTAPTMIMAAPPPRVEARAPRAAETLPANPLSEFNAQEVDSFIECTLIEADEAPGANAPDGPTSADAPLAAAAAAVRRTTAYVRIQQLASKLPPGVQSKLLRVGPYVGVFIATLAVGYFLFHRPPAAVRGGVAAVNVAAAPAPAPVAPPSPAPVAKAPPAEIEPPPAAAAAPAKPVKKAEKVAIAEKAAPAPVEKASPAEKPAVAEKAAPAEVDEEPAAEPAAPPVVAAGTPGVCTARVVTEPKDAKVMWDGKVIGRSPIEGARVPCGAAKVTIERERWQPVTVDVTMKSGDAALVRQRLHRPHSTLVINTSPPGAQISVNHVFVGAAPQRVPASRYEKVAIKAALKGHQTWNKDVYLREAQTKLDIQLTSKR